MGCNRRNRTRKPKLNDKEKKRLASYGPKLPENYRVSKRLKKKPSSVPAVLKAASQKEFQEAGQKGLKLQHAGQKNGASLNQDRQESDRFQDTPDADECLSSTSQQQQPPPAGTSASRPTASQKKLQEKLPADDIPMPAEIGK